MSMLVMREIAKGKVTAASDPDTMQTYAFVPDWARAAVALAELRGSLQTYEDVPFAGHAFTTQELRNCLALHMDRDIKINRFPWWLMTAVSPFWALAREMREMRYLYAMPHTVSGAKFDRLLPDFTPTDLTAVMLAGLPDDIHPNQTVRPSPTSRQHSSRLNDLPVR